MTDPRTEMKMNLTHLDEACSLSLCFCVSTTDKNPNHLYQTLDATNWAYTMGMQTKPTIMALL